MRRMLGGVIVLLDASSFAAVLVVNALLPHRCHAPSETVIDPFDLVDGDKEDPRRVLEASRFFWHGPRSRVTRLAMGVCALGPFMAIGVIHRVSQFRVGR